MLEFNSGLPLYYSVICILFGVLYSFFLYKRENSLTSSKLIFTLFTFRTLLISILAFLLLGPFVKSIVNTTERPIVIIAKDNSESVEEDVNDKLQLLAESLDNFEMFFG